MFQDVENTTCPDDEVVLPNGGLPKVADPEAVAVVQTVVDTNCPDDNEDEVVLVNEG